MNGANYLDNDEFERELAAWRASAEDPAERVPSERLGQLLMALHDGVLRHKNFRRYHQDVKDDMKSYSLYRILKNGLKSYDPSKAKAFSYFTRAVFTNYVTAVMRYYRKLNARQRYIKGELMKLAWNASPDIKAFIDRFRESGE